jgi:hypothetical protein
VLAEFDREEVDVEAEPHLHILAELGGLVGGRLVDSDGQPVGARARVVSLGHSVVSPYGAKSPTCCDVVRDAISDVRRGNQIVVVLKIIRIRWPHW